MNAKTCFILGLIFSWAFVSTSGASFTELRDQAERFYAEKSFAKAQEIYVLLQKEPNLSPAETNWVVFRLADTSWRAAIASRNSDQTVFEKAEKDFASIIDQGSRAEDRDELWADAQESMGDLVWRRGQDYNRAWSHYQQALDWWAGSTDLQKARKRWLSIMGRVVGEDSGWFGLQGVPEDYFRNLLKLAQTKEEQASAHYLLARKYSQGGDRSRDKVIKEYEAVRAAGRETRHYADALFNYAMFLVNTPAVIRTEMGDRRSRPDYAKALELFRRLQKEFRKGETARYDEATAQIESIIKPVLVLGVHNSFTPGSEVEFQLVTRNIRRVDFALYALDLTKDVKLDERDGIYNWQQALSSQGKKRIREWSKIPKEGESHESESGAERLSEKLGEGAYLLEARGEGSTARALVLVTTGTLVLKTTPTQALTYFCDSMTGAPIPNAKVTLLNRYHNGTRWMQRDFEKETDTNGIALFEYATAVGGGQVWAGAAAGARQAFAMDQTRGFSNPKGEWKFYVFSDRPAYRPGDLVQWKTMVRTSKDEAYATPTGAKLNFEIRDARGGKVGEGVLALNAFGSATGSLALTDKMPLGAYQIRFTNENKEQLGSATLFRLEEYKLPEFRVSVETPREDGKRKIFQLGDLIEAEIKAEYYFGGPVANANVEVVVYRNPVYHIWREDHEFPWYYPETQPGRVRQGGDAIQRETLRTDAAGKARLTIQTPEEPAELEFRIEARVTDSSRREIVASESIRVASQKYFVNLRPEHRVYRPQDKARVKIKTRDANEQPIAAEGRLTLTRDTYFEIWINPSGKEFSGPGLHAERERLKIFPPPPKPGEESWRLKLSGYEHEALGTQTLKTDDKGEAEYAFTPAKEGYYRMRWVELEDKSNPIAAESTVLVGTASTRELGYRHSGVEIIVDKETFKAGETAPVVINTASSGRYVLFSVESRNLQKFELIHLDGTAKFLQVAVTEKHVPNVFLGAVMVSGNEMFLDHKEVVVPPVQHFLTVEVKPDREEHAPGEEGSFEITAKDQQGRPVATEVAFAQVDASLFYIQQDLAGDPRQFFFGQKRPHEVSTSSSLSQLPYWREPPKREERVDGDAVYFRAEVESLSAGAAMRPGRGRATMQGGAEPRALALSDTRLGSSVAKAAFAAAPPQEVAEQAVEVRHDFRGTMLWEPSLKTDDSGRATVRAKYPDSLTAWKATVRAASTGSQFGIGSAETRTKKPLIVRLQAPRFFTVGDEVLISALVNNSTSNTMPVQVALDVEGINPPDRRELTIQVPAEAEKRVDWKLRADKAGTVKLKVISKSAALADAMENSYPCFEHGMDKLVSVSGKATGAERRIELNLPKERKPGTSSLVVQVTPSLAAALLDALPYLIEYPYGCTEQTMSRFLPAAVTAKTLADLGLPKEELRDALSKRLKLGGPKERKTNDVAQVEEMVRAGLERLYDTQHRDGSWGWWAEGPSDRYMTAYVVWGLAVARSAGIEVREDAMDRGAAYLDRELVQEENSLENQAWMLHALGEARRAKQSHAVTGFQRKAIANLWEHREKLSAYGRALFAIAAAGLEEPRKAKTLAANLQDGVKRDENSGKSVLNPNGIGQSFESAHWGESANYWRWSEGAIESTAFALSALVRIDPQNKLIEPAMIWLVKNRRGAQWSNTRDTAIALLALNEYLKQTRELEMEGAVEVEVNGHALPKLEFTKANVLQFPGRLEVPAEHLRDGTNEIKLSQKGKVTGIYYAAEARFFSTEEPVTSAGHEIFGRRKYYRLAGHPTLLKGYTYSKVELKDGEAVQSGDRLETVITLESKNDYEYLLLEDLKPAGFEAVEIRSGSGVVARELKRDARNLRTEALDAKAKAPPVSKVAARAMAPALIRPRPTPAPENSDYTGRTAWTYQEFRDRKVATFLEKLPQGYWELRYELRAEVPGRFHALPMTGQAMYVPEIRCNSEEIRVVVE